MRNHLIALDLDGTTLYDWKTLAPKTIKVVKALVAQGTTVVIATGRPYRASLPFYNQLGLNTPMISFNGAVIHHPNDPTFPRYEHFMPREAIIDIYEKNKDRIKVAFCEHNEDVFLTHHDEAIRPLTYEESGTIITGPFKETLNKDPHGYLIMTHATETHAVMGYIKTQYGDTIECRNWGGGEYHIIEVYMVETNKANGLQYLIDYYKNPQLKVLALGDGLNDVEMIRTADHGVAMQNAEPDVKQVADAIADHHQKDGVANYLTYYFNLPF